MTIQTPTTTNTPNPLLWGYDVRINDAYYRTAITGGQRSLVFESAPLQAPRVDTTANPEEVSNEYGNLYSRPDFSGGEGLREAHRLNSSPNDSRRYYDSKNIDVDDEGRLTLLESVDEIDASTADPMRALYADGNVWYTDGTTLQKSSNPTSTTPTFAPDDPHAGEGATTVGGLAALGTTAYAALNGNGIHRRTTGGSWTHWSDLAATNIWSSKGILLASDSGGDLHLARAGASSVNLISLPDGETWNAVTDADAAILACASDGYIYSLTFDGTDVAFSGAQTWLEGQEPTAITDLFGVVVFATVEKASPTQNKVRLYTARLNSDLVLTDLNVVREWTGPGYRIDRLIIGARTSAWFGFQQESETHLWRYDLLNGALHRSYIATTGAGTVPALFPVEDRLWFTVDGQGIQRVSDQFSTSGYLITSLADFFTADAKAWAGIKGQLGSAITGSATIAYTTTAGDVDVPAAEGWVNTQVLTSLSSTEVTLKGVESRYLALKISLEGTTSNSPRFDGFTVRAYPGPGDTLVSIPINVSDTNERHGKRNIRIPGRGSAVFDSLRDLEGTSVTLTLLREGIVLDGTVQQVSQPSPMDPRRGSQWMVSTLVFRGRITQTGRTTSNTLGAGLLGSGLLGLPDGAAA